MRCIGYKGKGFFRLTMVTLGIDAMWNNKCDNVLVYHRPNRKSNPNDPTCEFHSKKIRRQKIVGAIGHIGGDGETNVVLEYNRPAHRFLINGRDYIAEFKDEKFTTSQQRIPDIKPNTTDFPHPDSWIEGSPQDPNMPF